MVVPNNIISPQIAEIYGRSLDTVTKDWMQDAQWPQPNGKMGRFLLFDRKEVDNWVRRHRTVDTSTPIHTGDPEGWLTAREIAEETGKSVSTIRADFSRGRLAPKEGEKIEQGVKLWRRGAIAQQLASRRGYQSWRG